VVVGGRVCFGLFGKGQTVVFLLFWGTRNNLIIKLNIITNFFIEYGNLNHFYKYKHVYKANFFVEFPCTTMKGGKMLQSY